MNDKTFRLYRSINLKKNAVKIIHFIYSGMRHRHYDKRCRIRCYVKSRWQQIEANNFFMPIKLTLTVSVIVDLQSNLRVITHIGSDKKLMIWKWICIHVDNTYIKTIFENIIISYIWGGDDERKFKNFHALRTCLIGSDFCIYLHVHSHCLTRKSCP